MNKTEFLLCNSSLIFVLEIHGNKITGSAVQIYSLSGKKKKKRDFLFKMFMVFFGAKAVKKNFFSFSVCSLNEFQFIFFLRI